MCAIPLGFLGFVAAALAGCASVPAGPPPPPPELSFRGVRTVALIHRLDPSGFAPRPGESRRRDPLDALQGALGARGMKTVTVELTDRPPPELASVDQAARQAEWTAQSASPDAVDGMVGTIGELAAPALAQLGADAFAVYTRGPGWGAPVAPRSPFGSPYGMAPPPAPASALAVVARNGTVVTWAWGGGSPGFGAGPVNAAEAVDAALALLLQPPPE